MAPSVARCSRHVLRRASPEQPLLRGGGGSAPHKNDRVNLRERRRRRHRAHRSSAATRLHGSTRPLCPRLPPSPDVQDQVPGTELRPHRDMERQRQLWPPNRRDSQLGNHRSTTRPNSCRTCPRTVRGPWMSTMTSTVTFIGGATHSRTGQGSRYPRTAMMLNTRGERRSLQEGRRRKDCSRSCAAPSVSSSVILTTGRTRLYTSCTCNFQSPECSI